MNILTTLFVEPDLHRLGWVLIHFLWQGALIALLLAVALRILARASSHARYLLITTALIVSVVAPTVTWIYLGSSSLGLAATATSTLTHVADVQAPRPPDFSLSGFAVQAKILPARVNSVKQVVDASLPYVLCFWFTGVFLLSIRLTSGWTSSQRLTRSGVPIDNSRCLERFQHLTSRLAIHVPVRLLQSVQVEVPTLIGWLRPVILIPTSILSGLTLDQLEAILAHELAHVLRHDYLVNLLQIIVETVLFYHPAIWWMSSKLREERENCCDDIVIEITQDRYSYAQALARLEAGRTLTPALAASDGPLLQRIRRIAGVEERKGSSLPLLIALITSGFLAFPVIGALNAPDKKAPSLNGIKTAQIDSSFAPAQHPTYNPAVVPAGLIRVKMQVVEIGETDYKAHRTQIDIALKKGDIQSLSQLRSFDSLSEPTALIKSGEQATMEAIRVFPFAVKFEHVNSKLKPIGFERRDIGIRFKMTPTLKNGLIQVEGKLSLTSFEGWTQTGEKTFSPTFRSCDAYLFEEFKGGETKGIRVPGLQNSPGDTQHNQHDSSIEPPNGGQPKRVFLFLNAQAS